jgi:hypothetical protein
VQFTTFREVFYADLKGNIKRALVTGSSDPLIPMCLACKAVNQAAKLDDTVLIITHYRYWPREDLLRSVEGRSIGSDLEKLASAEERWGLIADRGFRFVMLDGRAFPKVVRRLKIDKETGTLTSPPAGIDVQTICHRDEYFVFRLVDHRSAP